MEDLVPKQAIIIDSTVYRVPTDEELAEYEASEHGQISRQEFQRELDWQHRHPIDYADPPDFGRFSRFRFW